MAGKNRKEAKAKGKIKFGKSFRVQLTLTFISLTATCILISIFISGLMLERYYANKQVEKIEAAFQEINEIANYKAALHLEEYMKRGLVPGDSYVKNSMSGQYWLDQNVRAKLDKISLTDNLKIILMDPDKLETAQYVYTTETSRQGLGRIVESMSEYILEEELEAELLDSGTNYDLYKAEDEYIDSENYDLLGVLDNGVFCFIRMNYESIAEAAAFTNNFHAYVGVMVILIEAIFILILSGAFTKPLKDMNEVAKRMAQLDFDAKAEIRVNNEFGQLAGNLNELSETLEETILELKTANNELQVDLDKRVEIDEMRRDFLGNVSHELKTPIAIIQGYAEGLKDNVNEDEESRNFYCDVIIDEATKMNTMVKKLLSLNRIEYGESQLEMERFDVVELIKGIMSQSAVLAGDKVVASSYEGPDMKYVFGDEYMIEEAITNYISNAYHHVSGENVIKVTLTENKDCVRVSVFNSGSNIPPEDLDKVWIKFYKVDKARTREYGGSGVGLSIVKAIMESMNQSYGVDNYTNGVAFWFELDIQ